MDALLARVGHQQAGQLQHLLLGLRGGVGFKVESKRADKSFPMTSIQLSQYVGGELHDRFPHLAADMHRPQSPGGSGPSIPFRPA